MVSLSPAGGRSRESSGLSRTVSSVPGVGYGQCVFQVRDQVVRVFYARRVPYERLGDAHRFALACAGLDVAGGGWRPYRGLDGPEVRRPVRELQAWQERPYRLVPASEREAQHPPETPHLPPGELVLRVGLQTGVENSLYARVLFQETRNLHGVLVVTRDAQFEGFQAAQEQVGGEGIEGRAVDLAVMVDPPHEFARPAQNAPEGVGVPPEVLGGAVEHEVSPEGERALVNGRGEGAVDHHDRAGRMPGLREAGYVDQLERGVRRRLQVEEVTAPGDLIRDGLGIRSIAEHHLHARPGQELQEDFVRPAVGVLHGDDAVAGLEESEKGVADGRHPGGETRRGLRLLQRPNLLLEGAGGGVGVAAVDVPLALAERDAHPLVEVVVAERDALDDGHLRRALDEVAFLPSPHGLRRWVFCPR